MVISKDLVNSIMYIYDAEGKLEKKRVIVSDGQEQITFYDNPDNEDVIVRFTAGGKSITSHSKTDSFGRKIFDELQLGTGFVSRQFSYYPGQITEEHKVNSKIKSTATTQLVSHIILSDGRTISYEYDAEERITKVTDSIDGTTEYTYDALGQLISEKVNGEVVNEMTYDNYGNILTKNGISYTYDTVWKDMLTGYGNQTISYDAQGNPTSYLGHTLTWEKGRQLKSYDNIQFDYNMKGIRTVKTVGGVEHNYQLNGKNIIRETWGENILVPLYDNEDTVCGIIYNDELYYFLKNLQGDIVSIVDKDADIVARYSYDAWGVCTIEQDSTDCGIASINPFRYRCYYYDSEIGFYYLQSRYYDPVVGRFINRDNFSILYEAFSLISYNLFAYCENNSISRYDRNGKKFLDTVKKIVRPIVRIVTVNPLTVFATRSNWFQGIFNLADFYKDSNGIYHTYEDCWQKYFGYNDLYDFVFDIGTNMVNRKIDFVYNKQDWMLWAWKGAYLNLGLGAELGIYQRFVYKDTKSGHWLAATCKAMRMEMILKYQGETIIDYKPTKNQWWITGFNPYYLQTNIKSLEAYYTLYMPRSMFICLWLKKKDDKNIWFDCCRNKVRIKV